ncbi:MULTISPECIES: Fur family transcriptional regulator [unclassified Thioalkalivibrio]|uniref:Fur family transcriptional regulator n=1 Tax=unclassified Thioalkalivibrio TaxID=2621013 RepID=UPI0003618846|nr:MULTISPECIES: transcriptional repressor [unclassified Thioalkalivibrio]
MNTDSHNPDLLSVEAARELLREHAISPTEQRVEIARVMFARHQHLSAEQILAQLVRHSSRVSKATVYNTLNLFAEKGLVREVLIDPAKLFYDSNLNPHHHLFHTDTGELEDVDPARIDISDLPPLPEGKELQGVDVVIRVGSRRS